MYKESGFQKKKWEKNILVISTRIGVSKLKKTNKKPYKAFNFSKIFWVLQIIQLLMEHLTLPLQRVSCQRQYTVLHNAGRAVLPGHFIYTSRQQAAGSHPLH